MSPGIFPEAYIYYLNNISCIAGDAFLDSFRYAQISQFFPAGKCMILTFPVPFRQFRAEFRVVPGEECYQERQMA